MPRSQRRRVGDVSDGPPAANLASLRSMSVYELRYACTSAGLPSVGRKDALVSRLANHSGVSRSADPAPTASSSHDHPPRASSSNVPTTSGSQATELFAELQTLIKQSVEAEVSNAVASAVGSAVGEAMQPVLERLDEHASTRGPTARPPAAIPPRLRDRICRGEFINFEELLPEAIGATSDVPIRLSVMDGEPVELLSTRKASSTASKRRIHDLATWLEAWTTFMTVLVEASPERAVELLQYQATIVDANVSFDTAAWLAYDKRFRTLVSADNRRFDMIDTYTWQSCFTSKARPACTHCALTHPPPGSICPFRSLPHRPTGTADGGATWRAPMHNGRQICRNFNSGRCDSGSSCPRAHACFTCKGNHPRLHCKRNKSSAGPSSQA